jgi:glutamate/tyrosine decarboxylase-like PLP-dependent enzyme
MTTQPITTELWETLSEQNRDKAIYEQAVAYAFDYLDTIGERRVSPSQEALEGLAVFDEPLPQHPHEVSDTLKMLHEYGAPATSAMGGGRYFGFVNGNIIPGSLAAKWMADAWDQNATLHVMSPIAAKLEQICEAWIVELLGLPEGTAAGFVTGTTMANACGLLAARNTLLKRKGWNVAEQGLFGAPPIRVVMSQQGHASAARALMIVGIGRANVEWIPADSQGRFDATQLPPLDDNTLLMLQAGNVATGAFDDFVTLCTEAQKAGAWVHIDGAFGLWAAASDSTKDLTRGIELADSWAVDAHKTLNAPYDNGIVLCKDRSAMIEALQSGASYLPFSETARDNFLYAPDMSRRARGIELWALLKSLGRSGIDALVKQLCDNAKRFGEELSEQKFHVLNDVVFNQVLIACETPELTQATLKNVQDSGECWCGGAQWEGKPAIRISVCSWATTPDDVSRSVQAFVDARQAAKFLG